MRGSELGHAASQVWRAATSKGRFRTGSVIFTAAVLLFAPAGLADATGQSDRVLVIHPGIYHIWFDQEPSQEVVDRFTQIVSSGKPEDRREPARVIRAASIFKTEAGEYEERPVWMMNFHWDRMILGAAEQGIPVYVTVQEGISMYEAERRFQAGLLREGMSEAAEAQVKNHAYSGGTYGARVNEQRILDVYAGVMDKHPNATVETFIHSQSGINFIGALKSLDRESRQAVAQRLGKVLFWDPAFHPVLAEFLAHLPGMQQAYRAVRGHFPGRGERELTRTDPPGPDGKRYRDRINAYDGELVADLLGVEFHFANARKTVSQDVVQQWATWLDAAHLDPETIGRLAGRSGITRVTGRDGETPVRDRSGNPLGGQPWTLASDDHNEPFLNDLALETLLNIAAPGRQPDASQFNPAYQDEYFRNTVVADMGSAVRSGGVVDGRTARSDRLENIPVWDGATGDADAIAQRTVTAMRGSAKQTVVIDTAGNEALAREVGAMIERQGGQVVYAQGLDTRVAQTVAGRQLNSVVVRLAPEHDAQRSAASGRPGATSEGDQGPPAPGQEIPVRLASGTDSLTCFSVDSEELFPTMQALEDNVRQQLETVGQPPVAGVAVHVGNVPLSADPMMEDGWSITWTGESRWFYVQHESWEGPELVYDGSEDSPEQIVSEVKRKVEEIAGAEEDDDADGDDEKAEKRKVVVGGDPNDPRVREVIAQLSGDDEDEDGEPGYEVVFVNCRGMSPRQAMRQVAVAVREEEAVLGVAMISLPDGEDSDESNGDAGTPTRIPAVNPVGIPLVNPLYDDDEEEEEEEEEERRRPPPREPDVEKKPRPRVPPAGDRSGVYLTDDHVLQIIDAKDVDARQVLGGDGPKP